MPRSLPDAVAYRPLPNPTTEAARYVAALLELLGDHDPLAVLEQTPNRLRAAAAGLADDALRQPEAPGKWSTIQVLEHLVDTETVYGYRLRAVVAEYEPHIAGYDHERWAERLRYEAGDAGETLDAFQALRRRTLRLLRDLADEEWQRAGRHAERGREDVRRMVQLLAGHDLAHLRQIERIRQAL